MESKNTYAKKMAERVVTARWQTVKTTCCSKTDCVRYREYTMEPETGYVITKWQFTTCVDCSHFKGFDLYKKQASVTLVKEG